MTKQLLQFKKIKNRSGNVGQKAVKIEILSEAYYNYQKNDLELFTITVPLVCYFLPVREDWRVELDVGENTIVDKKT